MISTAEVWIVSHYASHHKDPEGSAKLHALLASALHGEEYPASWSALFVSGGQFRQDAGWAPDLTRRGSDKETVHLCQAMNFDNPSSKVTMGM